MHSGVIVILRAASSNKMGAYINSFVMSSNLARFAAISASREALRACMDAY